MKKYPPVVILGVLMIALAGMSMLSTAFIGAYFWQRYPGHDFDPRAALALWWLPSISAAALAGVGADLLRNRRVRPVHYAVVIALGLLHTFVAGPLGVVFAVGAVFGLMQVSKHDV